MGVTYADRAANYCLEWGAVRLMEVPPTSIAGPAGTSRSPHRPIITAPLSLHDDAQRPRSPGDVCRVNITAPMPNKQAERRSLRRSKNNETVDSRVGCSGAKFHQQRAGPCFDG